MRSHSRLDLYAKSLAVTGLGCLGVIGALIDYWPNQTLLPDVPSVVERERVASVLTVVDVRGYASQDGDFITLERLWLVANETPHRTVFVSDEPRIIRANLVTAKPMAKVTFVGPKPPKTLAPESLSVLIETGLPAMLPTATLAELEPEPELWEPTIPTVLASNRSDDGFFFGVLRKTGSSVGTVGATLSKAGGSVVTAFRSVGELVKRAF